MPKVRLPLGIEDFAELIESGCFYVDKTDFIRELLDEAFKVNLITRPRRFGKTLTMSMLAEFFDIRKDNRHLFEGLDIGNCKELCREWMNQWPVLFLTLKDVNGRSFTKAYGLLKQEISKLCIAHSYLEESSVVDSADKNSFLRLKNRCGDDTDIEASLDTLTRMMCAHYKKPVILLIDEYDVPLAKSSDNGYYDEMLDVIRSLLGMAWKTNPSLKFAVVTGCLRIAKESIFTGANNFVSNSVSSAHYDAHFGFLEEEVQELLETSGCLGHLPELKKWYDGYRFGRREVYCPWDVINHVNLLQRDPGAAPGNYWKDTSHNNIIRRFIEIKTMSVNDKFEQLLSGGIIIQRIVEDLTYDLDHSSEDNLWSILYLTGYLTQAAPESCPPGMAAGDGKIALRIPNEEVKGIFAETVAKWFADGITATDRTGLFQMWWSGEEAGLTKNVTDILFQTISYFDYKEDYYHAFLAGLFAGAGWEVSSNSEQGMGRADIIVKDRSRRRALVIEVKRSRNETAMAADARRALEQIQEKQYAEGLLDGFQQIFCYGAAFYGKKCWILCKKDDT